MKEDPVFPFPQPAKGAQLDLRAAVRRARIEDAERANVTAELRGAEIARLEMLKEVLEPVFLQLPKEAELFDLGLIPGERPRLFLTWWLSSKCRVIGGRSASSRKRGPAGC